MVKKNEISKEKLYWLAFSAFRGVGPKRFALLIKYFGSAKNAWQAKSSQWRQIGLGNKLSKKLADFRKRFDLNGYAKVLQQKRIKCLFLDQPQYPDGLKNIDDPPFVLYVNGVIPADQPFVSVVGTRKMTTYGNQVTEKLVTELVAAGFCIVSGLARGVDSVAHRTTLSANGKTIAVLGSGLDVIYPWENSQLAKQISTSGGAVISEYPLGTKPLAGHFPARNRIISGLSLGVLVVEGGERSGSLITARLAGEQGREVFAVPGPIYHPGTKGPAHLLKLGAKLVLSVEDILEELNLNKFSDKTDNRQDFETACEMMSSKEEDLILSIIEKEPKHVDEIVRESELDTGQVTSLLAMMEIKGKVKDLGDMVYLKR